MGGWLLLSHDWNMLNCAFRWPKQPVLLRGAVWKVSGVLKCFHHDVDHDSITSFHTDFNIFIFFNSVIWIFAPWDSFFFFIDCLLIKLHLRSFFFFFLSRTLLLFRRILWSETVSPPLPLSPFNLFPFKDSLTQVFPFCHSLLKCV